VFAVLYREGILKSAAEVFSEKGVERLLPVLDYVDTHFKDDIKLEDACRILNVNKAHFCRLFKKTVGMSFVTYLNFVKVTKAEKMLMTTDKSISEIAEETGFSSAAYFAEIFKIHMHRSPGKYKKIKTEEEIQKQVNP
jgi:AraC-like DNA-binding protein